MLFPLILHVANKIFKMRVLKIQICFTVPDQLYCSARSRILLLARAGLVCGLLLSSKPLMQSKAYVCKVPCPRMNMIVELT